MTKNNVPISSEIAVSLRVLNFTFHQYVNFFFTSLEYWNKKSIRIISLEISTKLQSFVHWIGLKFQNNYWKTELCDRPSNWGASSLALVIQFDWSTALNRSSTLILHRWTKQNKRDLTKVLKKSKRRWDCAMMFAYMCMYVCPLSESDSN